MAASSNPQSVKIARKRGAEEPPSTLIIQAPEGESDASPVYYVRKRRDVSTRNLGESTATKDDVAFAPQRGPKNELARKLYKLKVKQDAKAPPKARTKRGRDDVATFVEQEQKRSPRSSSPRARAVDQQDVSQYASPQERPFKRPSRQPRAKKVEGDDEGLGLGAEKTQTEAEKREMEALAQYLHEAALEEVKREGRQTQSQTQAESMATQQRTMATQSGPKISGQRAREMHRRRVESNKQLASSQQAEDTDMSDSDYIYDTYVLAPTPTPSNFSTGFNSSPEHSSDVGYLVISPEDQDLWATYIDDLPTSDEDQQNSDEEDENAEDYYGADYPEDELSEDDEFGKGAYGYRRGEESEGEGYESDDVAWSDGGGEEGEVERMMNPFRYGRKVGGVS